MGLFDEDGAKKRLYDNKFVIDGLRKRGFTDEDTKQYIFWVSTIPNGQWRSVYKNIDPDDIKRRKRLAEKIRKLCKEIDSDPDASRIFVSQNNQLEIYSKDVIIATNKKSISQLLDELAGDIESYKPGFWIEPPDFLIPRKLSDSANALKEHVKRYVAYSLGAIPHKKNPPYELVSEIVNTLLSIDSVTEDNIRKISWNNLPEDYE